MKRFLLACKAFWCVLRGGSFIYNATIIGDNVQVKAMDNSIISNVTFRNQD